MIKQLLRTLVCIVFIICQLNYTCSTSNLDQDIAKYSIFSKTGSYSEVKDILNKLRKKVGATTDQTPRLNDFLLKSNSNGPQSSSPVIRPDDTEVSQNVDIVQDLFEGDIVLTLPQAKQILQETMLARKKRKVMRSLTSRWPTKNVNYAFDPSITGSKRGYIEAGIKHWRENTCLTFQESQQGDRLLFVNGAGCYSNVGHVGGVQEVSLGSGCEGLGVVAHEIGHILGFWHEQSRPDRDAYLRINIHNVAQNAEGNFDKLPASLVNDYGVAYDLGSAMHYGSRAFSISSSRRTIDTQDVNYLTTIGQRFRLSFIDIKQMNFVYCSDVCRNVLACQHGGYADPSGSGTRCNTCKCPDGFGGTYCETVQPSKSGCGGELVATNSWQTITSSGTGKDCNWLIRAPTNFKIILQMKSLELNCHEVCRSYVEVKYNANFEQTGARMCCDLAKPIISATNELVMMYRAELQDAPKASFIAQYKIEGKTVAPTPRPRPVTKFHQEEPFYTLAPNPVPPKPVTLLRPPAPVAFWSDWAEWTVCSEKCGGCGIKQRRRQCFGTECPGYDLQRANCNENLCRQVRQTEATCVYPKQVPCRLRHHAVVAQLQHDDTLLSNDLMLAQSLPDYVGGELKVGRKIHTETLFLNRNRRQNQNDQQQSDPIVLVKPIESERSANHNEDYCVRYVQYSCNSNSMWKLQDSPMQKQTTCCSGFEQNGNVCRKKRT